MKKLNEVVSVVFMNVLLVVMVLFGAPLPVPLPPMPNGPEEDELELELELDEELELLELLELELELPPELELLEWCPLLGKLGKIELKLREGPKNGPIVFGKLVKAVSFANGEGMGAKVIVFWAKADCIPINTDPIVDRRRRWDFIGKN